MARYFPRQTIPWQLEEPRAFRRLSLSLVAMAALAGLAVRLLRWAGLAYGPGDSWWAIIGGYAIGVVLLLGIATAHLGNYPVRHWLWRAPFFGLAEGATELAVSAALIALGVERAGTELAHWSDWEAAALTTLRNRTVVVSAFALLLAGVVQLVRFALLKRERRDSTAIAIHEEHVRQTQEHEVPK
jgi:hypothetical protein